MVPGYSLVNPVMSSKYMGSLKTFSKNASLFVSSMYAPVTVSLHATQFGKAGHEMVSWENESRKPRME